MINLPKFVVWMKTDGAEPCKSSPGLQQSSPDESNECEGESNGRVVTNTTQSNFIIEGDQDKSNMGESIKDKEIESIISEPQVQEKKGEGEENKPCDDKVVADEDLLIKKFNSDDSAKYQYEAKMYNRYHEIMGIEYSPSYIGPDDTLVMNVKSDSSDPTDDEVEELVSEMDKRGLIMSDYSTSNFIKIDGQVKPKHFQQVVEYEQGFDSVDIKILDDMVISYGKTGHKKISEASRERYDTFFQHMVKEIFSKGAIPKYLLFFKYKDKDFDKTLSSRLSAVVKKREIPSLPGKPEATDNLLAGPEMPTTDEVRKYFRDRPNLLQSSKDKLNVDKYVLQKINDDNKNEMTYRRNRHNELKKALNIPSIDAFIFNRHLIMSDLQGEKPTEKEVAEALTKMRAHEFIVSQPKPENFIKIHNKVIPEDSLLIINQVNRKGRFAKMNQSILIKHIINYHEYASEKKLEDLNEKDLQVIKSMAEHLSPENRETLSKQISNEKDVHKLLWTDDSKPIPNGE